MPFCVDRCDLRQATSSLSEGHSSVTTRCRDDFRRWTEAQWFPPFIAVCAFAGLRLGEAVGLQLEDVDFLRRTIAVRRQLQGETSTTTELVAPKFGSERAVYAPAELITLLAEHVRCVGVHRDGWLFSNGGSPLNRNSAGHQWRQVRKAAGLGVYTLHDLRHFYASGLIASGCDVVTVQRRSDTPRRPSPSASTPTSGRPPRTAPGPPHATSWPRRSPILRTPCGPRRADDARPANIRRFSGSCRTATRRRGPCPAAAAGPPAGRPASCRSPAAGRPGSGPGRPWAPRPG